MSEAVRKRDKEHNLKNEQSSFSHNLTNNSILIQEESKDAGREKQNEVAYYSKRESRDRINHYSSVPQLAQDRKTRVERPTHKVN